MLLCRTMLPSGVPSGVVPTKQRRAVPSWLMEDLLKLINRLCSQLVELQQYLSNQSIRTESQRHIITISSSDRNQNWVIQVTHNQEMLLD